MIRAPLGNKAYWERAIANRLNSISMVEEALTKPAGAPTYRAEFVWGLTEDYPRQTLTQYSRGDAIPKLYNPFPKVLDAWELSNREAETIRSEHGLDNCRDWEFKLSDVQHYNWCFWLVGLALVFDIPDDHWDRLVNLIRGEGEDKLLDSVMASRQADRTIGTQLLHKKPYARCRAAQERACR